MNDPKLLATIEGQPITWDGEKMSFHGRGRIDNDGTGPRNGDPSHQSNTSLHHNGKPLNAEHDRFIVLPPQLIKLVKPIVLGCQVLVFPPHGEAKHAVVGDVGPKTKLGEISTCLARDLGIDSNPVSGGLDSAKLFFVVYPGVAAETCNETYDLQPFDS